MSPSRDLLRLIEEGNLGGLAMDVFNRESVLAESLRGGQQSEDREVQAALELAERPNVIFTPHNAFNTVESVERKAEQSVRQVLHFLDKGAFYWEVP